MKLQTLLLALCILAVLASVQAGRRGNKPYSTYIVRCPGARRRCASATCSNPRQMYSRHRGFRCRDCEVCPSTASVSISTTTAPAPTERPNCSDEPRAQPATTPLCPNKRDGCFNDKIKCFNGRTSGLVRFTFSGSPTICLGCAVCPIDPSELTTTTILPTLPPLPEFKHPAEDLEPCPGQTCNALDCPADEQVCGVELMNGKQCRGCCGCFCDERELGGLPPKCPHISCPDIAECELRQFKQESCSTRLDDEALCESCPTCASKTISPADRLDRCPHMETCPQQDCLEEFKTYQVLFNERGSCRCEQCVNPSTCTTCTTFNGCDQGFKAVESYEMVAGQLCRVCDKCVREDESNCPVYSCPAAPRCDRERPIKRAYMFREQVCEACEACIENDCPEFVCPPFDSNNCDEVDFNFHVSENGVKCQGCPICKERECPKKECRSQTCPSGFRLEKQFFILPSKTTPSGIECEDCPVCKKVPTECPSGLQCSGRACPPNSITETAFHYYGQQCEWCPLCNNPACSLTTPSCAFQPPRQRCCPAGQTWGVSVFKGDGESICRSCSMCLDECKKLDCPVIEFCDTPLQETEVVQNGRLCPGCPFCRTTSFLVEQFSQQSNPTICPSDFDMRCPPAFCSDAVRPQIIFDGRTCAGCPVCPEKCIPLALLDCFRPACPNPQPTTFTLSDSTVCTGCSRCADEN